MIPFLRPIAPFRGTWKRGHRVLREQSDRRSASSAGCQRKSLCPILQPVDHDDIVVGFNRIEIPGLEGEGHVALGLKAGNSCTVVISE